MLCYIDVRCLTSLDNDGTGSDNDDNDDDESDNDNSDHDDSDNDNDDSAAHFVRGRAHSAGQDVR